MRRALENVRGWMVAQRPSLVDYLIIVVGFVVLWIGVLKFSDQYYPDSAHYVAMSLVFGGMPRSEALQIVYDWHVSMGYEPNTSEAGLFDWGLVKPRVVLPLLGVPFTWAFGPSGLAVLTGLLTLVLLLTLYWLLRGMYGRLPALATVVLVLSSEYLFAFFTGILTESLSALWGALALALALRYQRERHWLPIAGLVAVTVLSGFTRQATLIVAGAFFVAWLFSLFGSGDRRRWLAPMVAVVTTTLAVQLLQSILFPFSQLDQFLEMTGTDSLGAALLETPRLALHILSGDFQKFIEEDPIIIVIIGLAVLSAVIFWRRSESHLLLGAFLAIALYNVTNGNPTHFRYALPGFVFYAVAIAALFAHIQSSLPLGRTRPEPIAADG
ncbi:MAG: hypothetical protein ABW227_08795 [Gaiellaceae bacterium]